ncbi:MAG TPA: DMT family transporter [Saprospiraceae bacterium]|nr:DMT family transporter [Saprospiraceae bacterium]HPG08095.1 DMT family transporter [Saprospiraceae bacterium]HPR00038.1 DMT family transporter [Saprospiraceae bacterium]HRV85983.1 DMT family transporter [Saprospiraceae bacterium]
MNWRSVLVLVVLSLTWGSSFILIKKSLTGFNPYQMVAIRLSLTGILFLPWTIYRWRKIQWSRWPYLLVVGFVGSLIPFTLYGWGETQVSSSVAGIINALTPIFTMIIGILIFNLRFSSRQLGGILLGLAGAFGLIFLQNQSSTGNSIGFSMLMVIATACYGTSANTVKARLGEMHAVDITAVTFLLTAIPSLVFLLLPANMDHILHDENAHQAMKYVLILVLAGTAMATVLYYYLVQITTAIFASMVSYFMPIVAVLWGSLDGEAIQIQHFLAIGCILAGVYLVQRRPKKVTTE